MDEEKVAEQMTVLVVEPGYAPYEKTIPHDVQAMQEIVGGLITAIYPYEEPFGIVQTMKDFFWVWISTVVSRAAMVVWWVLFSCAV